MFFQVKGNAKRQAAATTKSEVVQKPLRKPQQATGKLKFLKMAAAELPLLFGRGISWAPKDLEGHTHRAVREAPESL